jgi:hypothetical protein
MTKSTEGAKVMDASTKKFLDDHFVFISVPLPAPKAKKDNDKGKDASDKTGSAK